jgi:hypothetical protein
VGQFCAGARFGGWGVWLRGRKRRSRWHCCDDDDFIY